MTPRCPGRIGDARTATEPNWHTIMGSAVAIMSLMHVSTTVVGSILPVAQAQEITVGSRDDDAARQVRSILLDVYTQTGGLDWTRSDNWLQQQSSVCDWYGIECYTQEDADDTTEQRRIGHIRTVDLSDNNLVGTMPLQILQLPYLQEISIQDNEQLDMKFLSNSGVDDSLGQRVTYLYLSNTQVTTLEGLASKFGKSLEVLHITKLGLEGDLPSDLYECTKLQSLYGNYNSFTGSISSKIQQLTDLENLYLYDNELTGPIPSEMGTMTALRILSMGENHFTGTLPTELERLTNAQVFSIQRKERELKGEEGIKGPLLSFADWASVRQINIEDQQLQGTIPSNFLARAPTDSRIKINLSDNELSGSIPSSLVEKRYLNIYLANNNITDMPSNLVASSSSCASIVEWMDGKTTTIGCDAFMCPPQTFAPRGRATEDEACQVCPGTTNLAWGQIGCDTLDDLPSDYDSDERDMLEELYNSMGGTETWKEYTNWLESSVSICDWHGVDCNSDGNVVSIKLRDNGLTGTVPSQLFRMLPSLHTLDLRSNYITFPWQSLADAQELLSLDVSDTNMESLEGLDQAVASGSISATLRTLVIANNPIGTNIPESLYALTNLEQLEISNCGFTGSISRRVADLKELRTFTCARNSLTGQLPTHFGLLDKMENLICSENRLEGTLPTELNNLSYLQSLSLHQTSFEGGGIGGPLPEYPNIMRLTTLDLASNRLTGTLPPNFMQFNGMFRDRMNFFLKDNLLVGSVPAEWSRFQALFLDVAENRIDDVASSLCEGDEVSVSAPEWMNGWVRDYQCDAILCPKGSYNNIGRQSSAGHPCLPCEGGTPYMGATSCASTGEGTEDSELDILLDIYRATLGSSNWIEKKGWENGSSDYCNNNYYGITCDVGGRVVKIDITQNGLTGTIPTSIYDLTNLRELNLAGNRIVLPFDGIEKASSLEVLNLSNTQTQFITGIEKVPKLLDLNLSDNQMQGSIPTEIFGLPDLQYLLLNNNQFRGRLMGDFVQLFYLRRMELHNNHFTGQVPASISSMIYLEYLNLAGNNFDGTIPTELNLLTNLEFLSIQRQGGVYGDSDVGIHYDTTNAAGTGLTGTLPPFDGLPNLRYLLLGYNSLSGTVPYTFLDGIDEKSSSITVDLNGNRLAGQIPGSLTQFDQLSIYMSGNHISSIASGLCAKDGWMGGLVASFGCDAILCPVDEHAAQGRSISTESSCQPCDTGTAGKMGSTDCLTTDQHQDNSERAVLELMYRQTGGENWHHKDHWMDPDVSVCEWYGITCASPADESIVSIELPFNGLENTLPVDVLNLPKLMQLNLHHNNINVVFSGVNSGSRLEYLDIGLTSTAELSGIEALISTKVLIADEIAIEVLPTSIFSLQNLQVLSMNKNTFSSQPIPSGIQSISNLISFSCSRCGFTGNVPTWLGSMQKLEYIRLAQNELNGPIPAEIEGLVNLKHLDLSAQSGNQGGISGSLPSFASQKHLVELYLHYNSIQGDIPADFLESSTTDALIVVDLRSNQLTGTIPPSLNRLVNVDMLLSNNKIATIPPEICNTNWNEGSTQDFNCDRILCAKGTWNVYGRAFGNLGCLPCDDSPSDFFGATKCGANFEHNVLLKFYNALNGPKWVDSTNWLREDNHCEWSGITCHEDGEFTGLIKEIDMPGNNLEGTFGQSIFQLEGLTHINLKQNDIVLTFQQIGNAAILESIILSETKVGSLQFIGDASSTLQSLHLTDAQLTGRIPEEIYSLTNLKELYLSYNELTGPLSTSVGSLQDLRDLYLFGNKLTGSLPSELGLLESVQYISLGENGFNGEIPLQMTSLPFLEVLSLQKERCGENSCPSQTGGLSGPVPSFNSSLRLKQLYLGYNKLTGSIPDDFLEGIQDKSIQVTVDLSRNKLTGVIPDGLLDIDNLRIYLGGNEMKELPDRFCKKQTWMDGEVANSGCSAIMCPIGTFNDYGRQINSETECLPCTYTGAAVSLGSTDCDPVGLEGFDDKAILFELYDATGGSQWKSSSNWLSDSTDFCQWEGIGCEPIGKDGAMTVTSIELDENNLIGIIPSILYHLPALKRLSVRSNQVDIGFRDIDEAPHLEELYLDDTSVESLDGIRHAPSLKKLHLQHNKYIGSTIPEEIYQITTLTELNFADSSFTGPLSTSIGNLVHLESLVLAGNDLQGSVPSEIGHVASLKTLDLSRNNFYGTLPTTIGYLVSIEAFRINNTGSGKAGVTGPLREFNTMNSLRELDLANNQITGVIPEDFLGGVLNPGSAAMKVYLQGNFLIGAVPSSLTQFPSLTIELADNLLTELGDGVCAQPGWLDGAVGSFGCDGLMCPPGKFSSTMGRQTSAESTCEPCPGSEESPYFGMSRCVELERLRERQILEEFYAATGGDRWNNNDGWLDDAIDVCAWYGISCRDGTAVESIVLGSNHLTGKPPQSLFELKSLENLWLYSNPMAFSFEGIEQATNLRSLLLDSTKLDSLKGISAAKSLVDLDVRFNNLKGRIPKEIEQLEHLETLSCADNDFTGTVPTLATLPKLKTLRMGNNELEGTLPSFRTLRSLTTLDLSHNRLFGSVPSDLLDKADVKASIFLDLSHNVLTGAVPEELGRFDDMTIYLRGNRIDSIDPGLCSKTGWNGGDVGRFQCDGLLCPSGSYSSSGRASRNGQSCEACPRNEYFGSTTCEASSSVPSRSSWMPVVVASVIPLVVSLCSGLVV